MPASSRADAQMLMKGTRNRSADELAGASWKSMVGSLRAHGDAHRPWVASDVMKGDEVLALGRHR